MQFSTSVGVYLRRNSRPSSILVKNVYIPVDHPEMGDAPEYDKDMEDIVISNKPGRWLRLI